MIAQLDMFDARPTASVRREDPRTSAAAATSHTVAKQGQLKTILLRLRSGPISADTAGLLLGVHRSVASARLGVGVRRGLIEPAGEHLEPPADGGRERKVLRYRLTLAGERECVALFGGAS